MTRDLTAFLEKCLADEGMTKDAIEYVLFSGCGTRIYNLRNCIFDIFGFNKIDDEFTCCDDCGAYGAYLNAMKKSSKKQLYDCCNKQNHSQFTFHMLLMERL